MLPDNIFRYPAITDSHSGTVEVESKTEITVVLSQLDIYERQGEVKGSDLLAKRNTGKYCFSLWSRAPQDYDYHPDRMLEGNGNSWKKLVF